MSFLSFGGGGGGSLVNVDAPTQLLGVDANGVRAYPSSQASGTGKGTAVNLGTVHADGYAGLTLIIGPCEASTQRFQVDFATDASFVNTIVSDFYMEPGIITGAGISVPLPLSVPGGVDLHVRARSNSPNQEIRIATRGIIRDANSRPLWNRCEALTIDNANVRANVNGLCTVVGAGSTTWTELLASLPNDVGAIMMVAGYGGSTPSITQDATYRLATGAPGAEVLLDAQPAAYQNNVAPVNRFPPLIVQKAFPAGTRFAGQVLATTVNSDALRMGLYGFRSV